MNKLSSKQIDNIEKAVNKATDLVFDEGLSPSEAIAKTASAMKLSSDYVPIIIHAFNNGAAEVHRNESSGLQEKVADFPIAKQDEVYRLLGQPLEKKASIKEEVDTFYSLPISKTCPSAWSHLDKYKYRGAGSFEKYDYHVKAACDRTGEFTDNLQDIAKKAADEAMCIKYAAKDDVENAYRELEHEMRLYGSLPIKTARMYAQAAHGELGLNIVNRIISQNNLEKKAGFRQDAFVTDSHPFAKKLKDLVFKSEQLKEAQAQEVQALKKCAEAMISRETNRNKPIPKEKEIGAMFKEGALKRKKKERQRALYEKRSQQQKRAYTPDSINPLTGATGLDNLNHPSWGGLDPFERDLMYGLTDPMHEARLRQIRVQSIMTDLMNTDPYLKDKDPEEVLEALNDILEINKDLHNNKPMLRVALRQFLESGGMDIPTLGVISDFGSKERDRADRERQNRTSQAIQQLSESTRLRENEITRALQEAQKLDDLLASAIQAGAERSLKKEVYKADRKSREAEGKATRDQQRELSEADRESRENEGAASRRSQENIANDRNKLMSAENKLTRDQQLLISKDDRKSREDEGQKTRDNAVAVQGMRDTTTVNEGNKNRKQQAAIAATSDSTAKSIAKGQIDWQKELENSRMDREFNGNLDQNTYNMQMEAARRKNDFLMEQGAWNADHTVFTPVTNPVDPPYKFLVENYVPTPPTHIQ